MIYLDNTQDLQEVWVPRNDGIRATRDDCFSTGYDSGYTDGFNDGRASGASLQEKVVDIVSEVMEITPDEGYDGMSKVTANATGYGNSRYREGFGEGMNEVISNIVPVQVTMDSDNMQFGPADPYYGFSEVTVDAADYSRKRYEEGREEVLSHIVPTAVTMESESISFEAEDPNYGFSEVSVDASKFIQGERDKSYTLGYTEGQENIISGIGTTAFTENGVYTALTYGWSSVTVNVPQTGVVINNQTKSVSITANSVTNITYDSEYTGLENVEVTVNVAQTGTAINNQTKTVEITGNGKTEVTYDSGYTGLEKVEIDVNVPQTGGTGKLRVADYPGMKFGYSTWMEVPDYLDFEGVTDMSHMFYYCAKFTGNVSFDMSGVTTIQGTFQNCHKINSVIFSNSDDITRMETTFYSCWELSSITINNTSKVTSFDNCFFGCEKLQEISLSLESAKDAYGMFQMFGGCSSLSALTVTAFPDADMSQIRLSDSPLTHESLLGLLNTLPVTSNEYSFQIGETNIAKLTEDEVAIATDKGWTLV